MANLIVSDTQMLKQQLRNYIAVNKTSVEKVEKMLGLKTSTLHKFVRNDKRSLKFDTGVKVYNLIHKEG